jgi:hypothetical protein
MLDNTLALFFNKIKCANISLIHIKDGNVIFNVEFFANLYLYNIDTNKLYSIYKDEKCYEYFFNKEKNKIVCNICLRNYYHNILLTQYENKNNDTEKNI